MQDRQPSLADYTVGWICALPVEMGAARLMLDEEHPRHPEIDRGMYLLGSMSGHNVVLACLPAGIYGTSSASIVAMQMLNKFPDISVGLMVGIAGGVPSQIADIRLGDVVVSRPVGTLGGVVQYDLGKTLRDGRLHRTGSLSKPPSLLLSATAVLEASHSIKLSAIPSYLSQMVKHHPYMGDFLYPRSEPDILFNADYQHIKSADGSCTKCSRGFSARRRPRPSNDPAIHYGTIASGNQIMRDGITRDRIAQEIGDSVLCFEMEASGLMDHFPCLVIRGICDYADSHKNKHWQRYASATAAAYAKELLSVIPTQKSKPTQRNDDNPDRQHADFSDLRAWMKEYTFVTYSRTEYNKSAPIYQGEVRFDGPVSNSGGVLMGNIASTGGQGMSITGSTNYRRSREEREHVPREHKMRSRPSH